MTYIKITFIFSCNLKNFILTPHLYIWLRKRSSPAIFVAFIVYETLCYLFCDKNCSQSYSIESSSMRKFAFGYCHYLDIENIVRFFICYRSILLKSFTVSCSFCRYHPGLLLAYKPTNCLIVAILLSIVFLNLRYSNFINNFHSFESLGRSFLCHYCSLSVVWRLESAMPLIVQVYWCNLLFTKVAGAIIILKFLKLLYTVSLIGFKSSECPRLESCSIAI